MVRARATVDHLDAVWKIDLTCKINLKNHDSAGKVKKITSVTETFTGVLLPSAATAFSTSAKLIFRITLVGPPILLAKNTSSVSGT